MIAASKKSMDEESLARSKSPIAQSSASLDGMYGRNRLPERAASPTMKSAYAQSSKQIHKEPFFNGRELNIHPEVTSKSALNSIGSLPQSPRRNPKPIFQTFGYRAPRSSTQDRIFPPEPIDDSRRNLASDESKVVPNVPELPTHGKLMSQDREMSHSALELKDAVRVIDTALYVKEMVKADQIEKPPIVNNVESAINRIDYFDPIEVKEIAREVAFAFQNRGPMSLDGNYTSDMESLPEISNMELETKAGEHLNAILDLHPQIPDLSVQSSPVIEQSPPTFFDSLLFKSPFSGIGAFNNIPALVNDGKAPTSTGGEKWATAGVTTITGQEVQTSSPSTDNDTGSNLSAGSHGQTNLQTDVHHPISNLPLPKKAISFKSIVETLEYPEQRDFSTCTDRIAIPTEAPTTLANPFYVLETVKSISTSQRNVIQYNPQTLADPFAQCNTDSPFSANRSHQVETDYLLRDTATLADPFFFGPQKIEAVKHIIPKDAKYHISPETDMLSVISHENAKNETDEPKPIAFLNVGLFSEAGNTGAKLQGLPLVVNLEDSKTNDLPRNSAKEFSSNIGQNFELPNYLQLLNLDHLPAINLLTTEQTPEDKYQDPTEMCGSFNTLNLQHTNLKEPCSDPLSSKQFITPHLAETMNMMLERQLKSSYEIASFSIQKEESDIDCKPPLSQVPVDMTSKKPSVHKEPINQEIIDKCQTISNFSNCQEKAIQVDGERNDLTPEPASIMQTLEERLKNEFASQRKVIEAASMKSIRQIRHSFHKTERHHYLKERKMSLQINRLNRKNKKMTESITAFCVEESQRRESIKKALVEINERITMKCDTAVLEGIVRHMATRCELKKCLKKKVDLEVIDNHILSLFEKGDKSKSGNAILHSIKNRIKLDVLKAVSEIRKDVDTIRKSKGLADNMIPANQKTAKADDIDFQADIMKVLESEICILRRDMEMKIETRIGLIPKVISNTAVEEMVHEKINCVKIAFDKLELKTSEFMKEMTSVKDLQKNNDDFQTVSSIERITKEFDEKLYLICADLSATKSLYAKQAVQPFYRCAQWIWNSGKLKLGSAIPWNIETANTDKKNFKWLQDGTSIRVQEGGLYEITLAFFTRRKPSIQLVVNGESILSAINSPSYIVHHASGLISDGNGRLEEGSVGGISLVVFQFYLGISCITIKVYNIAALSRREKE